MEKEGTPLTVAAERSLPMVLGRRRPGLAALAVVLVLGGALTTTQLVLRTDQRISVIRVNQQIGTGQAFTPAALQEALIAHPERSTCRGPSAHSSPRPWPR